MKQMLKYAAAILIGLFLYGIMDAVLSAKRKPKFNPDNLIAENATPPPTIQVGRFAIVQLGSLRFDQMLLDTGTGHLWRVACKKKGVGPGGCADIAWQPEYVTNLPYDQEMMAYWSQFPPDKSIDDLPPPPKDKSVRLSGLNPNEVKPVKPASNHGPWEKYQNGN